MEERDVPQRHAIETLGLRSLVRWAEGASNALVNRSSSCLAAGASVVGLCRQAAFGGDCKDLYLKRDHDERGSCGIGS